MEILFRRGRALPWTSQLIGEDVESGQIVKIGISQSGVVLHFLEYMCQLVAGARFYLPNDELAFILNLFMEKVMKTKCKSSEVFEQLTWTYVFLAFLVSRGKVSEDLFSRREALDALNARIKESQESLREKVILDLVNFKVFYFFRAKWKRIKGKSVTKSAFGLWVTREKISKLIKVTDFQVLVCAMRKNETI